MKYPRITIIVSQKQRDWLEKEANKRKITISMFIKSILFDKTI